MCFLILGKPHITPQTHIRSCGTDFSNFVEQWVAKQVLSVSPFWPDEKSIRESQISKLQYPLQCNSTIKTTTATFPPALLPPIARCKLGRKSLNNRSFVILYQVEHISHSIKTMDLTDPVTKSSAFRI